MPYAAYYRVIAAGGAGVERDEPADYQLYPRQGAGDDCRRRRHRIGFILFGLNYSLLLAVLVGFSVLIPYIGAFVVTIPVVGVALFQFGAGTEFWSLFAVYLIIQGLDGNLLVPVLFSEAVNLHPLVIILSVVIFRRAVGFLGVFFAIPLATLIKAVVHARPDGMVIEDE